MSLADLRWLRGRIRPDWEGLRPPSALPDALLRDLAWHRALYEEDGLPRSEQCAFLALRIVQRVAYNIGWHAGGRG